MHFLYYVVQDHVYYINWIQIFIFKIEFKVLQMFGEFVRFFKMFLKEASNAKGVEFGQNPY